MIIGLLTGRGGNSNQSLPFKNSFLINRVPLMLYPYYSAKKSRFIDDIYISTDGKELKEIAYKNNIKVINRPKKYSKPDSQHIECIEHTLSYFKKNKIEVNILVILMCNIAIQPKGSIDGCIKMLLNDKKIDSVVTVREWGDHHPSRAKTIDKNGNLVPIIKDLNSKTTTRQLLDKTFYLDHQVWAFRITNYNLPKAGPGPWYWMGKNVKPYFNKDIVVDVHDISDIEYSKLYLKKNG